MVFVAGELPWVGQTTRTADMLDRAVRLDPNAIDRNRWVQVFVYFHARRYEDAVTALEIIGAPTMSDKVRGAMIHAQLGRAADLERWRARLLEQSPDFSAESYFDIFGDYAPGASAERAQVLESLAKAGLPLCATPEQIAAKPGMRRMPDCDAERAQAASAAKTG